MLMTCERSLIGDMAMLMTCEEVVDGRCGHVGDLR